MSCTDAMTVLRNEITNLKNKLLSTEQKTLDLHSDVKTLAALSQTAGQSLNSARTNLVTLSDNLAQLYHLVCTVNGDTPNRVLLDHKTEDLSLDSDSLSAIQSQLKSDILVQQPNVFEERTQRRHRDKEVRRDHHRSDQVLEDGCRTRNRT